MQAYALFTTNSIPSAAEPRVRNFSGSLIYAEEPVLKVR
jgi:hypothetical protein